MTRKRHVDLDVLTAARRRISVVFDRFDKVTVAFSGGKDSTVMLSMVAAEAKERGRTFALLFIDLEAQYKLTIDFISRSYEKYAGLVDPYWLALPLSLRNATSMHEPKWVCWDPTKRSSWVREPSPASIVSADRFPWFRAGMEFEDLIDDFAVWYAAGSSSCSLVAIRSDESINRFRVIAQKNPRWDSRIWTTQKPAGVVNGYPMYDWRTADIWRYHALTGEPYNPLYDRMHAAGLTVSQMRICQPYGDDQRKGLWLYHVIEPETWPRIVARVGGANSGALYCREDGSINGVRKVSLPDGHTWKSYAALLLDTLPPHASEHYKNKVAVFLKWYQTRGYPGDIPDVMPAKQEATKKVPSWRRICKTLLRNDWWCKGLGFSQHRSGAYDSYTKRMKKRRQEWGIF